MRYLALFRDGFREALDRKSLWVMLAVSAVLVLMCLSVSFMPLDDREALQAMTADFAIVGPPPSTGVFWRKDYNVAFTVGEVAPLEEGRDGFRFGLSASPEAEAHRLMRHWIAARGRKVKEAGDPIPEGDEPADAALQARFIKDRFRDALLPNATVETAGPMAWTVEVRGERRSMRGAEEMGLFFGLVRWRPRMGPAYLSSAQVVAFVQVMMAEVGAGLLGMVVALVSTCGIVPGMLRKGTVDVLIAREVNRSLLLLFKFLGACSYVLILGGFLIGGCWLALSLRTGHWNLHFPATILTIVFLFGVLYSVSVLTGVLTGSAVASGLVAVFFWFLCSSVGGLHAMLGQGLEGAGPSAFYPYVRFVYLLLPKTGELGRWNLELISRGNLEGEWEEMTAGVPVADPWLAFGSSALFAAVMLAFACARFSRRDC